VGVNSVFAVGREDKPINTITPPRPGKKASPIETCRAETQLIGEYLSDNLDISYRQAFENHLQACPECAAFLATYKKTIEITRGFLKLQSLTTQPVHFKLRLPSAL
jgi:hypothetical protein